MNALAARLYPNECVRRVTAFIPPGHRHIRLLIEFSDGKAIILHEATVAGIVRAYTSTALHPTRKAVSLSSSDLEKRKPGYARWQLVEDGSDEDYTLNRALEAWSSAEIAGCGG